MTNSSYSSSHDDRGISEHFQSSCGIDTTVLALVDRCLSRSVLVKGSALWEQNHPTQVARTYAQGDITETSTNFSDTL